MTTTFELLRAFGPTPLSTYDDERLVRVCSAHKGEIHRFGSADNVERAKMTAGMGAFSQEIKNKFGTVWTDQQVVAMTVDEAFKHFSGDLATATVCDPACGDGNFLVELYYRLLPACPIADPVERSLDVLSRVYGVDIISRMAAAAYLRLLVEHARFLQSKGVAKADYQIARAAEIAGRNVIHGNTLRTEGDTWALEPIEGGMTPAWFRALKFSLVCGNPPYTKYKTRDRSLDVPMAYPAASLMQSFLLWAKAHSNDTMALNLGHGVLYFNTASVRKLIHQYAVSIIDTELTRNYSKNEFGGNSPTIVLTLTARQPADTPTYNGRRLTAEQHTQLRSGAFLNSVQEQDAAFRSHGVHHYVGTLAGGPKVEKTATATAWNDFIAEVDNTGDWHLGIIYMPTISANGKNPVPWKLFRTGSLAETMANKLVGNGQGYVRLAMVSSANHAKLLWCFLNSELSKSTMKYYGKEYKTADNWATYQINANTFQHCIVPDLEHYNTSRPLQYQAALDFADTHIVSNNTAAFAAGVDAVINNLLGLTASVAEPEAA